MKLRTGLADISYGRTSAAWGLPPPPPQQHGGSTERGWKDRAARAGSSQEAGQGPEQPQPGPGLQPHLPSVSASFSFPSSFLPVFGAQVSLPSTWPPQQLSFQGQASYPDRKLLLLQLSAPANLISCAWWLGPHRTSEQPGLTLLGRRTAWRGAGHLPCAQVYRQDSVCHTQPRLTAHPGCCGLEGPSWSACPRLWPASRICRPRWPSG